MARNTECYISVSRQVLSRVKLIHCSNNHLIQKMRLRHCGQPLLLHLYIKQLNINYLLAGCLYLLHYQERLFVNFSYLSAVHAHTYHHACDCIMYHYHMVYSAYFKQLISVKLKIKFVGEFVKCDKC